MKSQLTLVAAVFFGAMGGSFLTRVIEPAKANNSCAHSHKVELPEVRRYMETKIGRQHTHDHKPAFTSFFKGC